MSVLFDDFMVTGPDIPDNGLKISSTYGKILLTWPQGITDPVLIQTTDSLQSPTRWSTVTNAPVVSGAQQVLTLDMTDRVRFYRWNR